MSLQRNDIRTSFLMSNCYVVGSKKDTWTGRDFLRTVCERTNGHIPCMAVSADQVVLAVIHRGLHRHTVHGHRAVDGDFLLYVRQPNHRQFEGNLCEGNRQYSCPKIKPAKMYTLYEVLPWTGA